MRCLCVLRRGTSLCYGGVDEVVGSAFAFVLQCLVGSSEL